MSDDPAFEPSHSRHAAANAQHSSSTNRSTLTRSGRAVSPRAPRCRRSASPTRRARRRPDGRRAPAPAPPNVRTLLADGRRRCNATPGVSRCLGMRTRDGAAARIEPDRPRARNHSIRRPDIAREMTSCWISLVPSKIVWLTLTGFVSADQCCHVPLTWAFANRVSE